MLAVENKHIALDAKGRPYIAGTGYRVEMIVADHTFYGYSPAEICEHHYNELSLAQVHAALSYYFDHQAEIDQQIKESNDRIDAMKRLQGDSPAKKRLIALGLLK